MDKHRSIEEVIANLDEKKYTVPENWPYKEARRLFKTPDIADPESLDVSRPQILFQNSKYQLCIVLKYFF